MSFNFPHLCATTHHGNYIAIRVVDLPSSVWMKIGWWPHPLCYLAIQRSVRRVQCVQHYTLNIYSSG